MIYTIDNPKLVHDCFCFKNLKSFTGVVKDRYNTTAYYLNGILHRVDGPAVIYDNGTTEWLVNGLRHRTDGPSIHRYNGDKFWYIYDKRHREDGPAVELIDGRLS